MRYARWTLALAVALCAAASGQQTVLRHTNFVAFAAQAGDEVALEARSIARAPYADDLYLRVLGPDSATLLEQRLAPDQGAELRLTAQKTGLHVALTASGQCLAVVRTTGRPWALVARDAAPVQICGAIARQYFLVPAGCRSFSVYLESPVTGEGALVRVWSPEGTAVLERTDDFDKLTRLDVPVDEGQDGKPWSLTVASARDKGYVLDDMLLYLGPQVPPLLCERPEWLDGFVSLLTKPLEEVTRRVKLGSFSLNNGVTREVRFQLEAAPTEAMAALRTDANDVDYAGEGSFTVNGKGPYLIPITGDATTATVTVLIPPGDLVAGENVVVFRHDAHASAAMRLSEIELLLGATIAEHTGW